MDINTRYNNIERTSPLPPGEGVSSGGTDHGYIVGCSMIKLLHKATGYIFCFTPRLVASRV